MKYFVVSDIFSYHDILVQELEKAGFDRDNPDHTLIVCGNCFDKGPQPIETMNFLERLPRKILITGNHEELLLDLINRGYPTEMDRDNGTVGTIQKFLTYFYQQGHELPDIRDINNLIKNFLNKFCYYYETKHYIFVHSWIPTIVDKFGRAYNPDWRDCDESEWPIATWRNPFDYAEARTNGTHKTIVFGHKNCSYGYYKENLGTDSQNTQFGADAIWEPYKGRQYIGINRSVDYTNQMNVLVLEDEPFEEDKEN